MSSRLISHSPPLSLATKIDSAELPTISPSIRPSWMREIVDVVEQPRHKSIPNPNPANRLESRVQLKQSIARTIICNPVTAANALVSIRVRWFARRAAAQICASSARYLCRRSSSPLHPGEIVSGSRRPTGRPAWTRTTPPRAKGIGAIAGSTAHLQLRPRPSLVCQAAGLDSGGGATRSPKPSGNRTSLADK